MKKHIQRIILFLFFAGICRAEFDFTISGQMSISVDGYQSVGGLPSWRRTFQDNDMMALWNDTDIPVEERIAGVEFASRRLKFFRDVCPQLELKMDLDRKKISIQKFITEIEKIIGAKIPYKSDAPESLRITISEEGYRAYEVIEALADQTGASVDYIDGFLVFTFKNS